MTPPHRPGAGIWYDKYLTPLHPSHPDHYNACAPPPHHPIDCASPRPHPIGPHRTPPPWLGGMGWSWRLPAREPGPRPWKFYTLYLLQRDKGWVLYGISALGLQQGALCGISALGLCCGAWYGSIRSLMGEGEGRTYNVVFQALDWFATLPPIPPPTPHHPAQGDARGGWGGGMGEEGGRKSSKLTFCKHTTSNVPYIP